MALSRNLAIYFDVPVFDLGSILILSFVFCLLFRLLLPSFIYNSLGTLGYFYSLPPSLSRARACSLLSILPRAFWYKFVEPIDRATNRSTETLVYFAKAPLSSRSSCSWTPERVVCFWIHHPHTGARGLHIWLGIFRCCDREKEHTHTRCPRETARYNNMRELHRASPVLTPPERRGSEDLPFYPLFRSGISSRISYTTLKSSAHTIGDSAFSPTILKFLAGSPLPQITRLPNHAPHKYFARHVYEEY